MGKLAVRSSRLRLIPALLLLASCGGTPPQSTAEFRQQMAAHRRGRVERWTVADSPAAVSERLRYAVMSCFAVTTEQCGSNGSGGRWCFRTIYTPRAIEETPSRRTLTVQAEVVGASRRAPPGGIYTFVVDVEPDSAGTGLTFYGTSFRFHDRTLLAMRRWSQGLELPLVCPDGEAPLVSDIPPASSPAAPTAPTAPEPAR